MEGVDEIEGGGETAELEGMEAMKKIGEMDAPVEIEEI